MMFSFFTTVIFIIRNNFLLLFIIHTQILTNKQFSYHKFSSGLCKYEEYFKINIGL